MKITEFGIGVAGKYPDYEIRSGIFVFFRMNAHSKPNFYLFDRYASANCFKVSGLVQHNKLAKTLIITSSYQGWNENVSLII